MEDNGGDEVDVLEDAEALEPADVPQPDRLVHAARQDEEVLAPGDVEQVAGVAGVGDEGPVHEDVADAVGVRHVVLICDFGIICHARRLKLYKTLPTFTEFNKTSSNSTKLWNT